MRATELVQLIRQGPFVPLRLHLTDGTAYEIRHPDQIIVMNGRIDIGIVSDTATGVAERVEHCSLLHLVRVEPIPVPSGGGNGDGRPS
jgi:hypothetical protein